jgi:hypothetical protein
MWFPAWKISLAAILICVIDTTSELAEAAVLQRQTSNTTSSITVQQLVAGIGNNIMAQTAEKAVLSQLQNLAATPTPDLLLLLAAKDDLLSFMACGSRIRSNNLKLSSVNPQVMRGLAQACLT